MSLQMNLTVIEAPQLNGRLIQLRLLTRGDYSDLAATCLEPEIWRETIAKIRTSEDLSAYLETGLKQHALGQAVPFVIRLKVSGTAVGSTRLASTEHPGVLEIGWSFVAPAWHRKGINAEAKLLLLDYAFGPASCRRVLFKVSNGNERSISALTSFGAMPSLLTGLPSTTEKGASIRWFEVVAEDWMESRAALASRVARALEKAG
jgi:RimJ/RimL family protein N-acetyltransferase